MYINKYSVIAKKIKGEASEAACVNSQKHSSLKIHMLRGVVLLRDYARRHGRTRSQEERRKGKPPTPETEKN